MTTTHARISEAVNACEAAGLTVAAAEYTTPGTWRAYADVEHGGTHYLGVVGDVTTEYIINSALELAGDPADVSVRFEPDVADVASWTDMFYPDTDDTEPEPVDGAAPAVAASIPLAAVVAAGAVVLGALALRALRRKR